MNEHSRSPSRADDRAKLRLVDPSPEADDPEALSSAGFPGPTVSVVIRSYNEAAHIGKLLEGLERQTTQHEVIVVDSGSTDGTVGIARRYGAHVVQIHPQPA